MMEQARVKMLRGTALGGGVDAYPGEVVSVSAAMAEMLVRQARAVYAPDAAAAAPAVEAAAAPEDKPARKGKKNA